MAAGATETTPPEPARPLSDHEKAAFARLEAETLREDPEWSGHLAPQLPPRSETGPRARDLVIQVVVVAVLAVVLMPSAWLGGLLAVIVLIGLLGAALWASGEERSDRGAGGGGRWTS